MIKQRQYIAVIFIIILGTTYINSTSFFRLKLIDYRVRNGQYDVAIKIGKKVTRKESLLGIHDNKAHVRLIRAYAQKGLWYGVAQNIKQTYPRYLLRLDRKIDNYLLGSFLMSLAEREQACKYFERAVMLDEKFYDAKIKLKILKGIWPPSANDFNRMISLEESLLSPMSRETQSVSLPNSGFEKANLKDREKPQGWIYYSGSRKKEENPWGVSAESRTGNRSCFLKQLIGDNAWLFSGDNEFTKAPTEEYELCPATAYQIVAWIKADRPVIVSLYSFEYDTRGRYTEKKLANLKVFETYQEFSSPIIFSNANTLKFRIGFNLLYQKGKIFIDDVEIKEHFFFEKIG